MCCGCSVVVVPKEVNAVMIEERIQRDINDITTTTTHTSPAPPPNHHHHNHDHWHSHRIEQVLGVIDRVDEDGDGNRILIDYKTGNCPSLKYNNQTNTKIVKQSFRQLLMYTLMLPTEQRVSQSRVQYCHIVGSLWWSHSLDHHCYILLLLLLLLLL